MNKMATALEEIEKKYGRDAASDFERLLQDVSHEIVRSLLAHIQQILRNYFEQFRTSEIINATQLQNRSYKDLRAELQRAGKLLLMYKSTPTANDSAVLSDSIARAFLKAVETWPHANPSDVWWFVIYRAYCDPFNHPAERAHRDFGQSWKRAAGWALEGVLVRHYGPYLQKHHGINLFIATGERKDLLLHHLEVEDRLEADKVDVFLTGHLDGQEVCFGVVHVKASFAERRTDDVPMSRSLVQAGYTSPLWTMDCKSTPSPHPKNRGELGKPKKSTEDRRSAKRKDIEEDGYFSACFSYNQNTVPTPSNQPSKARIYVCDFSNSNDAFTRFVAREWQRFTARAT